MRLIDRAIEDAGGKPFTPPGNYLRKLLISTDQAQPVDRRQQRSSGYRSSDKELSNERPFIDLSVHHRPKGLSDRIAFGFTKVLRWTADTFFAERYGHRAVVLETVAAVPGMVGATINHLHCLRRMCDDKGWIRTLMDEAENERMHLMTFIEISKPTWFERAVIIGVQWVFYCFFFALYLISSKTAHRVVGYFEEEAVISYTPLPRRNRRGPLGERAGAGARKALLGASRRRAAARRGPGGPGRRSPPPRRQPRLRKRTCWPSSGKRRTLPATHRAPTAVEASRLTTPVG